MKSNQQPMLELHIDELILHGFSPNDGEAIREAVAAELNRLLAGRPLPGLTVPPHDRHRLTAPAVQWRAGTPVAAMAASIAGSVYQGLAAGNPPGPDPSPAPGRG
jgi:hypothetical protein